MEGNKQLHRKGKSVSLINYYPIVIIIPVGPFKTFVCGDENVFYHYSWRYDWGLGSGLGLVLDLRLGLKYGLGLGLGLVLDLGKGLVRELG